MFGSCLKQSFLFKIFFLFFFPFFFGGGGVRWGGGVHIKRGGTLLACVSLHVVNSTFTCSVFVFVACKYSHQHQGVHLIQPLYHNMFVREQVICR